MVHSPAPWSGLEKLDYTDDCKHSSHHRPDHSQQYYCCTLDEGDHPRQSDVRRAKVEGETRRLVFPEGEDLEERREDEDERSTGYSSDERDQSIEIRYTKC